MLWPDTDWPDTDGPDTDGPDTDWPNTDWIVAFGGCSLAGSSR